ncbi:MAG TPA: hypothetical protein VNK70_02395 [Candidatus Paceibacterota bacterium]|nr:hypothetical protein [Candidatus Paceibacterota bacterium]
MAQTATTATKNKFGSNQFPIHYEGGYLRVYTNPSGELFVEDTRSGVSMRINPSHPGGLQFTTDGRVEPIRVTNTIGWCVERR